MRILGLVLVGVLALSVPIIAHADPLEAKMRPAGPAPGTFQLDGSGPGGHPNVTGDWATSILG